MLLFIGLRGPRPSLSTKPLRYFTAPFSKRDGMIPLSKHVPPVIYGSHSSIGYDGGFLTSASVEDELAPFNRYD